MPSSPSLSSEDDIRAGAAYTWLWGTVISKMYPKYLQDSTLPEHSPLVHSSERRPRSLLNKSTHICGYPDLPCGAGLLEIARSLNLITVYLQWEREIPNFKIACLPFLVSLFIQSGKSKGFTLSKALNTQKVKERFSQLRLAGVSPKGIR